MAMRKKIEADAIVALAGLLCILFGAYWVFGSGGVLICLGITLVVFSPLEFTKIVMLTDEEREHAIVCYPHKPVEEAYSLYAEAMLEAEAEGWIRRSHSNADVFARKVKALYAMYVVNFRAYAKNAKVIIRGIRERLQAIKLR